MCVVWVHDVWWVFNHNGITQQIIGSMGTNTYRSVAHDEENLNMQNLDQTECVKWPKIMNVSQNQSFWTSSAYIPVFTVVLLS